uniref:Uncharacterized protein n=1 Tax=Sinocyclocheilus rhinocerous TaxID=307959 RepID=A0A673GCZ3_9TELE
FGSACLVTSLSVSLQIIAVNSSSDAIITNVPDLMATEIPRIFLLDVPQSSAAAQAVNRKKWKHEQVRQASVLQGFTCSRIQSFSTSKVLSLIRGCRRRANQTLVLQESQLTCMHHYIKSADLSAFSQYPAEVLIYYNYSMIDRSLCRSYFSSLGVANFSVLSSTLSFKKQTLFNHARGCLGISGVSISRDQLDVLGSMSCFLSGEYIQSSDPYVLEKLKPCVDLSAEQISALESILLGGNTSYGPSDSWNRATLESLDLLPLYLTANIWSKFTQANKQRFLKTFIRDLRKNDKASETKILNMMNEVNKISRVKIKRSAGENHCRNTTESTLIPMFLKEPLLLTKTYNGNSRSQRASALSLTSCSSEKKSILFSIAQNAFNTTNTRSTNPVSITTYQLLQNYLGNNTHTHTDSRHTALLRDQERRDRG